MTAYDGTARQRDLADESASLQCEFDRQRTTSKQQLAKLQRDSEAHRQRLEAKNSTLQTRVEQLEFEKNQDAIRADTAAQGPQVAWGEDRKRATIASGDAKTADTRCTAAARGGNSGNQEGHDLEKVIEKLRLDLSQKDRVGGCCAGSQHYFSHTLTRVVLLTLMNRRSRCYNRPFIASASSARRCWRRCAAVRSSLTAVWPQPLRLLLELTRSHG